MITTATVSIRSVPYAFEIQHDMQDREFAPRAIAFLIGRDYSIVFTPSCQDIMLAPSYRYMYKIS